MINSFQNLYETKKNKIKNKNIPGLTLASSASNKIFQPSSPLKNETKQKKTIVTLIEN